MIDNFCGFERIEVVSGSNEDKRYETRLKCF